MDAYLVRGIREAVVAFLARGPEAWLRRGTMGGAHRAHGSRLGASTRRLPLSRGGDAPLVIQLEDRAPQGCAPTAGRCCPDEGRVPRSALFHSETPMR